MQICKMMYVDMSLIFSFFMFVCVCMCVCVGFFVCLVFFVNEPD